MTYTTEASKVGRVPIQIIELDLDRCFYEFAQSAVTNIIPRSEEFAHANWIKGAGSAAADGALRDPRGGFDGSKINSTTIAEAVVYQDSIGNFSGSTEVAALYVKHGDADQTRFGLWDVPGAAWVGIIGINWNLDGRIDSLSDLGGSPSGQDWEHIVDGWYRVWFFYTGTATNARRFSIYPNDGAAVNEFSYIFGAAAYNNNSLKHYVKTTTTTATAGCSAVEGIAGKCYNTRASCQDPDNYTRGLKTYRFVEQQSELPPPINAIPSLISLSPVPIRLTPGKGLGQRANVTGILQDHSHHDRETDPYPVSRAAFPGSPPGTFWSRFTARNKHYNGRTLRTLSGYQGEFFDWRNFDRREYVIDRIDGPDSSGRVRILGKDILKLADDKRAQCPVASSGSLSAAMTDVATTFSFNTGEGAEYPSSNFEVRIGDEIMLVGSRTGDACSSITRETWGTTKDAHSQDDAVQLCKVYQTSNNNVRDIIDDLLVNFAGVPSAYINATDWDTEETDWLSAYDLTTIISEPTGVNTLLAELMEQCQVMVWWDSRAQQIRLKAIVPPNSNLATTIGDAQHILADSVKIKDLVDERITRMYTLYDKLDYTEDKGTNYQRVDVNADSDKEGDDQFGDVRIETIKSRWFSEDNSGAVAQTASRALNARKDTPQLIQFSLDAKDLDAYDVGAVVDLQTDCIVDFDGNPRAVRGILIEENESKQGHQVNYRLQTMVGSGRFFFIGPNTLNDYSAESAANKAAYGFIGPNSGNFSDGGERYKII